jgi:hypothetical protein
MAFRAGSTAWPIVPSQGTGVLDDEPGPGRDDGGGLGSALGPASSHPEPKLPRRVPLGTVAV